MQSPKIKNPWLGISLKDYEEHMSHPSVGQLQQLNKLFKDQYDDYHPIRILYLGICSGNGLEHINSVYTNKIFGIDINKKYLEICKERFCGLGSALTLLELDLNKNYFITREIDLVVANLVLEYIELKRFLAQVQLISYKNTIVSIVFQKKNKVEKVSMSGVESVNTLKCFINEIDTEKLILAMETINFRLIYYNSVYLNDGKEFIRVDFKN